MFNFEFWLLFSVTFNKDRDKTNCNGFTACFNIIIVVAGGINIYLRASKSCEWIFTRKQGNSELHHFQKQSLADVLHRKTPILECLFDKVAGLRRANLLKRDSTTGVFQWILKIYFEKHLRMASKKTRKLFRSSCRKVVCKKSCSI